jgi:hypothetical protein
VLLWRKVNKDDYMEEDPGDQGGPRIVNGYMAESLTSGFNTEFFLDHLHISRIEGVGTLSFLQEHPVWSNYDVIVEKIGDKKVGLVSIKAKNPED